MSHTHSQYCQPLSDVFGRVYRQLYIGKVPRIEWLVFIRMFGVQLMYCICPTPNP